MFVVEKTTLGNYMFKIDIENTKQGVKYGQS